jgi:hypothetical protein
VRSPISVFRRSRGNTCSARIARKERTDDRHLLNTLVGLGLAYAAIFPGALGTGRDRFGLIAAVALIIFAL